MSPGTVRYYYSHRVDPSHDIPRSVDNVVVAHEISCLCDRVDSGPSPVIPPSETSKDARPNGGDARR